MTYEDILKLTMQSTLNFCYVVLTMLFCVLLILETIYAIWQMILKKVNVEEMKKAKERRKKARRKSIINVVVILLMLVILLGWQVAPAALDIAGKDYVIVEGTIKEFSGTGTVGNGVYHGGAYIVTEDGEEIQIQFSPGMSNGFPNGEFYATVVYAKRSHYLLDIYPGMSVYEAINSSETLLERIDQLIFE